MGEIPQHLKAGVTGRAGVRAELGSACPGALRGCLGKLPVCILRQILQIFPWLLLFLGFCGSVWAGFFCSSLVSVLAVVFAVSASLSGSLSSLLCHELNMSPRFDCCIPAPSAEAVLARLQELGELQFGWAQCKLHVLRPLAVAPEKVLTVFSLLCKTCFEQFISWP